MADYIDTKNGPREVAVVLRDDGVLVKLDTTPKACKERSPENLRCTLDRIHREFGTSCLGRTEEGATVFWKAGPKEKARLSCATQNC